jgi:pimeloyl-ACP methyl ester carboxylesterase
MSRVESGFAEVNGTRLYYEARGRGRPILFLHGFTLDHRMWREQAEALSARFRVVTCDARGFGRSAMPSEQPYKHCEDVAALLEHLGLGAVVLVGHSVGGHQTLELALTRPDLVGAWAGICFSGLARIPFPDEVKAMFARVRTAAREGSLEAAKRMWSGSAWFAPARRVPQIARELDAMLSDYSGWHWTHDRAAQNIDPPAADRLVTMRMPALIVTGERDLPYNGRVADALLRGIAGATALRLSGASHMANMEDPASVNRAIAELADRTCR